MKKFFLKSAAFVVLASMFMATVAGCSPSSTTATTPAASKSDSESKEAEGSQGGGTESMGSGSAMEAFANQVEIKIPVYDRAVEGLPPVDNNYWTRWVQKEFGEKYNVKVTYVAIPRNDEVNKINMLVAANDAPTLIYHYDYPQAVTYASQGALKEIDMEAFKAVAPTYYKTMEDKKLLDYTVLDGKNQFILALRPEIYSVNYIKVIRQDWLDEVKMESPTNYKEFQAVVEAWVKAGLCEYPLGKFLPTTGYTAETYDFREIPTPDQDLALYSDLAVASLPWKPTYDYLKRTNEEYNKGYYSAEFYLDTDRTQFKADFVSGKIGIYYDYLSNSADYIKGLTENFPEAKLSVLDPRAMTEDGTYPAARAFWPFGLIIGFSSSASDDQVKAASMLLEWLSQPENLFVLQNGYEGKTYTLDDQKLPVISEYTGEEKLNYNSNKDMYALVIEGKDYGSPEANLHVQTTTFAPAGFEYLIEDNYKFIEEQLPNFQPDFLFNTSILSVAEYKETLLAKWQEYCVDLMTCKPEEFEAMYKKYSEEYLKAGYQEILDERLTAFEAQK